MPTLCLRFVALSAALGLLAAATSALARPVPRSAPPACSVTDTTPNAIDCGGYFSGNTSLTATQALIAAEGWAGFGSITEYKDDTVTFGSTLSDVLLFDAVRTSASDDSFGQVTFRQALEGPFVLALKGGNNWAGYLFGGRWAVGSTIGFDIPGVQGMGLSHVALYTSSVPTVPPVRLPPASVSEPATWALALMALGGIAGARFSSARRRA